MDFQRRWRQVIKLTYQVSCFTTLMAGTPSLRQLFVLVVACRCAAVQIAVRSPRTICSVIPRSEVCKRIPSPPGPFSARPIEMKVTWHVFHLVCSNTIFVSSSSERQGSCCRSLQSRHKLQASTRGLLKFLLVRSVSLRSFISH